MKLNPLGRSGLFVSELCLGTMTFGGGDEGMWGKIGRLQQDDLPVDLGNGDPLDDGESASDQAFLHLVDDLGDVEDDLVSLHRHGARLFTLQDADKGALSSGVRGDPEVGEGVGGDEGSHL